MAICSFIFMINTAIDLELKKNDRVVVLYIIKRF